MAVEAVIFTQIVDVNWDQAIYTASPNNTINVAQFAAKGSGTNIGIALTPKGTGYISAQVADGTAAGGNARGANAVDFQTSRALATAIASGARAFVGGGISNRASGDESTALGGSANLATGTRATVVGGASCQANGANSVAGGNSSIANATDSLALGNGNTAGGEYSVALGRLTATSAIYATTFGLGSVGYRPGMIAYSATFFDSAGDVQSFFQPLSAKTTTNTEVVLTPQKGATAALMSIPSGKILHLIASIVGIKSDGSAAASYMRQITIKRVGSTTSLVGTVNTIGVDEASGTSISITADDANDALKIGVTGVVSETWRWHATLSGSELAYGS